MQNSIWKLAAVVGVSGLGFLVILQVQKGLHDAGTIQAAELHPAETAAESESSAPSQAPARATSVLGRATVTLADEDASPPVVIADAGGIDFRTAAPAGTAGLVRLDAAPDLKPVPKQGPSAAEPAGEADPFAALRSPAAVVPAGHAEGDSPASAAIAQAGDFNDFGPDPFAAMGDFGPDSDAAGLEEPSEPSSPSPREMLDAVDPFGEAPAPDLSNDDPAATAAPPESDDPFGAIPTDRQSPAMSAPAPDDDPFGLDSPATDPAGDVPAADPFGGEPEPAFDRVLPVEGRDSAPAPGDSLDEDDPFGAAPDFGALPPDFGAMPPADAGTDSAPPETLDDAAENPFGNSPPSLDFGSPGAVEESPAAPSMTPDEPMTPTEEDDPFASEAPPASPAPIPDSLDDQDEPPMRGPGPMPVDDRPFPESAPPAGNDRPRLLPSETPADIPPSGPPSASRGSRSQKAELTVEKKAPGKATLGQPLVYEIRVTNVGESAAHEVTVTDVVPKGTNLEGTIPQAALKENRLVWNLATLEPGAAKTIKIKVTPVEPGQIGSVATVNFVSEVAAETNVVAPHLTLKIVAPQNVAVGQPVDFRFEIGNDGTAAAEKVVLRDLLPTGFQHSDGNDIEYEVGTLPPGAMEAVTLRVAAVQAGQFTNKAVVTAAGGLKSEATADVAIASEASAGVVVIRRGPKQRFVGRPATYHNVVRNGSPRAARDLKVIEQVPEGMEFVSASHGGQFDPDRGIIAWMIPSLPAGQEQNLQVVLTAASEGIQDSTVTVEESSAAAPIEVTSTTTVTGLPDLAPRTQGLDQPIVTGERAAYRIRVANRGDAPATDVTVGVALPADLKLVDARGGTVQTDGAGRAVVRLDAPVPAGGESNVEFLIEGSKPGRTTFRAEVNASYLDSPLIKDQELIVVAPRS